MLLIPKKDIKLYITKEDETLSSVALKNKVNEEELIKRNSNIYLLPGQLLIYKE